MSLARIPLAVLVYVLRANPLAVLAVSAVAGVTDMLDGWMARGSDADRRIGSWLDPLCDKIFVLALLFSVVVEYRPPLWMAGLTATRELIMAPLYAIWLLLPHRHAMNFTALPSGKATTVAQFSVVLAVLTQQMAVAAWLAVLAAILGVLATLEYAWRARNTLLASSAEVTRPSPNPSHSLSSQPHPQSDTVNSRDESERSARNQSD